MWLEVGRFSSEVSGVTNGGVSEMGDASSGVFPPPVEACPEGCDPCIFEMESEPGAEGVTYRTNEAIARKTPLA